MRFKRQAVAVAVAMAMSVMAGGVYAGTVIEGSGDSTATGGYAFAMGYDVTASGDRSTAMGHSTEASGTSSTAMGRGSKATADNTTAMGYYSEATKEEATAMGFYAIASGKFSVAMGAHAHAEAESSVAMGQLTTAAARSAIAMGENTIARGYYSTATGYYSLASGIGSFAGGYGSSETARAGVAYGYDSFAFGQGAETGSTSSAGEGQIALGKNSKAIGSNSLAMIGGTANGQYAIAIGSGATATPASTIAIGTNAKATGASSIAIGIGNQVSGSSSGAFGDPNIVTGANSYAFGNNNTISTNNSFVLGNSVTTTYANSVVLGNGSAGAEATAVSGITIKGAEYTFTGVGSGTTVIGSVSVGSASNTRQIKNVAPGAISGTSTDAVNGSQLYAVTTAIEALGGGDELAVRYDVDGTGNRKNSVTLLDNTPTDETVTPVAIQNVASAGTLAADNTNAVNGGDLYLATRIEDAHNYYTGSTTAPKTVIEAVNLLDAGIGEKISETTSYKAISASNSVNANLIALDRGLGNAVMYDMDGGVRQNSVTLLDTAGATASNVQIKNVASAFSSGGTFVDSNTNAVNGGDLYTATKIKVKSSATETLVENLNAGSGIELVAGDNIAFSSTGNALTITSLGGTDTLAVHYDTDTTTGGRLNSITLLDTTGATASNVQIKNVASAGTLSSTNYNAVNGADLYGATRIEDAHNYYTGSTTAPKTVIEAVNALDFAIGSSAVTGTHIINKGTANTVYSNLQALDTAIGSISSGSSYNVITAGASVSANLVALDGELKTTTSAADNSVQYDKDSTGRLNSITLLDTTGATATPVAIQNVASAVPTGGTLTAGNTNAVNGGDLYAATRITTGGHFHYDGSETAVPVIEAINELDRAIGPRLTGTYNKIDKTKSVNENLILLDSAIATATGTLGNAVMYTMDDTTRTSVDLDVPLNVASGGKTTSIGATGVDTNGTVKAGTSSAYTETGKDGISVVGSGKTATLTSTALTLDGKTYVSTEGLNANNQKVINVADGTDANDAATFGQLSSRTTLEGKHNYFGESSVSKTSVVDAIENLDAAIGSSGVTGTYINRGTPGTNTVYSNLKALDDAITAATGTLGNAVMYTGTGDERSVNLDVPLNVASGGKTTSIGATGVDTNGTVKAGTSSAYTETGKDGISVVGSGKTATLTSTALTLDGKIYVSTEGLNANNQKVINVADGTAVTDAATVGQVQNYSTVKVNGGANINTGSGIEFVAGDNIELSTVDNKLTIKSLGGTDKVAVHYATPDSNKLTLDDRGSAVLIGNVATPENAFDAANKQYVDSSVASVQQSIGDSINRLDNKMTKKINRLGAKSAAMSALQPMGLDGDHKVSASAGFGIYGGERAAAVGIFYKPTENLMFNIGGAAGRGSVMGNFGMSYRFGGSGASTVGLTKTAMAEKISFVESNNRAVQAQLRASLSREEAMAKRVATAEDRVLEADKRAVAANKRAEVASRETQALKQRVVAADKRAEAAARETLALKQRMARLEQQLNLLLKK